MASFVTLAPTIILALFLSTQCFQPPPNNLSKSLLRKREGDRSHWCCSGDRTPVVTRLSRHEAQRYVITKNTTFITDYEPCYPRNFNNSMEYCPVYKTQIVKTPAYRLVTVFVNKTETPACREEDLGCCKGYTLFMENCYLPSEMKQVQSLIDAGLIG